MKLRLSVRLITAIYQIPYDYLPDRWVLFLVRGTKNDGGGTKGE